MKSAAEAYDEWHEKHDSDDVAHDSPWHRMVKARLRQDIDIASKVVLEIGCGRGGFANWLAASSNPPRRLIAADFSPLAVQMAKAHAERVGVKGVDWQVQDLSALKLDDQSIDTAISFETIEHVPCPRTAVAELARVLKPGGRLYLTTPNYCSSVGLYRVYCYLRGKTFDEGGQPICHLTYLSKTRRWIGDAGLELIDWTTCGQYLPIPGRPPIDMRWAESPKVFMKYFGLHSLVVATK